jgi:phenylacetate-coenzyme A ligase PaaK-like adenylate-forming protein
LGGEKSDEKLLDNIQKLFPEAKINNVYASTEAGAIFCSRRIFQDKISSRKPHQSCRK